MNFGYFKKLKIYEHVLQNSLWQSFKTEKSETAIFFFFPRSLLWCTPFFLSMHFSPRKSRNKIACFDIFEKTRKFMKSLLLFLFFGTPCWIFFYMVSIWSSSVARKKRVKFRAKLRSGEGVEHKCFCDIRLGGMYFLGMYQVSPCICGYIHAFD